MIWILVYLLCAAVFFLSTYDWALEAVEDCNPHLSSRKRYFCFFFAHLFISLTWACVICQMIYSHLRRNRR